MKEKWKDNYALYRYGDHYDDLTSSQKATVDAYIEAIDIDEVVGVGNKNIQELLKEKNITISTEENNNEEIENNNDVKA